MLTQEQMIAKEALENFILDPETQEIILTGSPGTGKSYLLKELTNVLKDIKSINTLGFEIPYNKIVHTATTNKASLLWFQRKTLEQVKLLWFKKAILTTMEISFLLMNAL